MDLVDLDDLDPDPMKQFGLWYADAMEAGIPEPTAMALATASSDGRPSVRHVLLKGFDGGGFVWFTNYESRKGLELADNPFAAIVFPWFGMTPSRQVIVRGSVTQVDGTESDAYFATRPRQSQLAAWASDQSHEIPDRVWLEHRYAELEDRFEGGPVPRPPHWGGYRLRPDAFEFWQNRPNRLHDRIAYRPRSQPRTRDDLWAVGATNRREFERIEWERVRLAP